MEERQKFSFSILIFIRFVIMLTGPFVFLASLVFLLGNLKFKLSMEVTLTLILVILIGFILFLYYKTSILVIIEDDRILVKKTFITKIDSPIKDLVFDGHISSYSYGNRYGSEKILKSLLMPSKIVLVFSESGEKIKIDASGLGSNRASKCIDAIYQTGIKNF